jgi:hypothetical protein
MESPFRLAHLGFASVLGHQIPEVTHLVLPDAMDATKPLLQSVRIPRQVVADHEVRALDVHTLARRIVRHEGQHGRIVHERVAG